MGFIDCIKGCFNDGEIPIEPIYRAVIFGEGAVFIENVRAICYFNEQEILLSLKRGALKIWGCGLYVKKYQAGDVVICGKIKGIERV